MRLSSDIASMLLMHFVLICVLCDNCVGTIATCSVFLSVRVRARVCVCVHVCEMFFFACVVACGHILLRTFDFAMRFSDTCCCVMIISCSLEGCVGRIFDVLWCDAM